MISDFYKYCFIHIPKTGGTSIEYSLLLSEGITRPKSIAKMDRKLKLKYFPSYLQNRGHQFYSEIPQKIVNEYFSFAFVRNPWDRFVSEYHWNNHCDKFSFKEFLNAKLPFRHENSQVEFLDKNINFIGRFENLQQDFDIVCDRIGIPHKPLFFKNTTSHRHYTEYYNNETRKIIAQKYAKDIEYLNYKFGQ